VPVGDDEDWLEEIHVEIVLLIQRAAAAMRAVGEQLTIVLSGIEDFDPHSCGVIINACYLEPRLHVVIPLTVVEHSMRETLACFDDLEAHVYTVPPCNSVQTGSLVCHVLKAAEVEPESLQFLQSTSGGNVPFLMSILSDLIQARAIVKEDRVIRILLDEIGEDSSTTGSIGSPTSSPAGCSGIMAVITKRIDALGPRSELIVKLMACLAKAHHGKVLLWLLLRVLPEEEKGESFHWHLTQLVFSGILKEPVNEGEGPLPARNPTVVEFASHSLQKCVYERLLHEQRCWLHRYAAELLDAAGAAEEADGLFLMINHLQLALNSHKNLQNQTMSDGLKLRERLSEALVKQFRHSVSNAVSDFASHAERKPTQPDSISIVISRSSLNRDYEFALFKQLGFSRDQIRACGSSKMTVRPCTLPSFSGCTLLTRLAVDESDG